MSPLLFIVSVQEEDKAVLTTFSYFSENWIEPTIFPHKCQLMENMTECGFVYLFRDHTRYEIMSNFDVKHSQVVSLFFFLFVALLGKCDCGCGMAGPEEKATSLPVFSKVQTYYIHSSTGRCWTICNHGNQFSYMHSCSKDSGNGLKYKVSYLLNVVFFHFKGKNGSIFMRMSNHCCYLM